MPDSMLCLRQARAKTHLEMWATYVFLHSILLQEHSSTLLVRGWKAFVPIRQAQIHSSISNLLELPRCLLRLAQQEDMEEALDSRRITLLEPDQVGNRAEV